MNWTSKIERERTDRLRAAFVSYFPSHFFCLWFSAVKSRQTTRYDACKSLWEARWLPVVVHLHLRRYLSCNLLCGTSFSETRWHTHTQRVGIRKENKNGTAYLKQQDRHHRADRVVYRKFLQKTWEEETLSSWMLYQRALGCHASGLHHLIKTSTHFFLSLFCLFIIRRKSQTRNITPSKKKTC